MNRKISTVFVYCITFFLAACSSTPTPNLEATVQAAIAATEAAQPTETPTPQPPDTPTPRPTNTSTAISTPVPSSTSDLGDIVEQDGYTLSVMTFEDPTIPNTLYQAVEGQKLVAVEIVVGNVSGEQLTTNPASATLVDSEGFLYPPKLGSRDGQLSLQALNPGEKIRGWIAFEIPSQAIATSIKYLTGGFPRIELEAGVPSASEVQPAVPTTDLGDIVEQDGYTLSVMTFEDPTIPNMLYQVVEGQKLVAVEIVVGNVSGEQFTTNPASATLVDSEGFLYPPKLGSRDGQLSLQVLNPGEKIRGWIAFEIPSQAIVASIKYPAGSSARIDLEAEVPSASEVQPAVPTIEPTSTPTTAPPTPTVALATPTNTPIPTPTQPPQAVCICSSDTYNCGDFATHARAQACFDYCRTSGQGDIHRLDRDNDGLVCESLP